MAVIELARRLQSGFLAYDSNKLETLDPQKKTIRQLLVEQTPKQKDIENYFDLDVRRLFAQFHAGSEVIRDFTYREMVIATAFRLFADKEIKTFFLMQIEKGDLSYTHQRYLVETIEFVAHGKPRTVSNSTYFRLLNPNHNDAAERVADKRSGDYSNDVRSKILNHSTTKNFISEWTSDLSRFSDMVETLNVIFGCRKDSFEHDRIF